MSIVLVTQEVYVKVDRSKFTEEFMEEFRENFFPFDTVEEHIEHLGQLYARGVIDNRDFIEGYGPAEEMGIHFENGSTETEMVQS